MTAPLERVPLALRHVCSVLETPILDDRKWAKIPGLPMDAVLLDLEDSAPPNRKAEARERVVRSLAEVEYFDGRVVFARSNNLSTPWGRDDLLALGRAGVQYFLYPKLRSSYELLRVQAILRSVGADPYLVPIIETAPGLLDIEAIARVDRVVGLASGFGDLAHEVGYTLVMSDGQLNPALGHVLLTPPIVAAARGLMSFASVNVPDIRDQSAVMVHLQLLRGLGYSAVITYYPPHVDAINEAFRPSPASIAQAELDVREFEAAMARGEPAATVDGRTILRFDYLKSRRLLGLEN